MRRVDTSSYQQSGIDGSGEGSGVENEEWTDIESVYTPYDQFASNDHLPPVVDTPYGVDSAYPRGKGRGDKHTDNTPGKNPLKTISTSVEVPIHQAQETQIVTLQAPNRCLIRNLALATLTGPATYAPVRVCFDDNRRSRLLLQVGTGADKPVWVSHEMPNIGALPGPYSWPLLAGAAPLELHTTGEIWVIADPTGTIAPQLYVIEETRR